MIKGIKGVGFWLALRIGSVIRRRLNSLHATIMEERKHGTPQNLALLVWGKAQHVADRIEELGDTFSPVWEKVLSDVPADRRSQVAGAVVKIVLRLHANYSVRILERTRQFLAKLLWFAKESSDDPCAHRANLAMELLSTEAADLHVCARKVNILFSPELQYVVESGGRCPMSLFATIRWAALRWRCDDQAIEGIMN